MPDNADTGVDRLVGANVRRLRLGQGLTQAQLSDQLRAREYPITQPAVLKIENGSRPLRVGEVLAIAEVLEVDPSELYTSRPHEALSWARALDRALSSMGEILAQALTIQDRLAAAAVLQVGFENDTQLPDWVTAAAQMTEAQLLEQVALVRADPGARLERAARGED